MKLKSALPIFGIWLLTILVWSAYRYFIRTSEIVDEIIFKPIVYILPIWIYLKNQFNLENLGWRIINLKKILLWGILIGLFFTGENIIISLMRGGQVNSNFFFPNKLLINFFVSIATALTEEILYRGFILERLGQIYNHELTINIFTSMLFSISHIAIGIFVLNYLGGQLISYLLLIFLMGIIDGILYQHTRSVVAPSISHFLWNFSVGLFV